MFLLFRIIANIFDARLIPYETAKGEVEKKQDSVQKLQTNVQSTLSKIAATQEQINAFNNALLNFANGCKNNDGFAIVQGHKRLKFPQSVI